MRVPLQTVVQHLLLLASLVRAVAAAPVPAVPFGQRAGPRFTAAGDADADARADASRAADTRRTEPPAATPRIPTWLLTATGAGMFSLGAFLAARPYLFRGGSRRGPSSPPAETAAAAADADGAHATTATPAAASGRGVATTAAAPAAVDLGTARDISTPGAYVSRAAAADAADAGTVIGRNAGGRGGAAAYPSWYYEYLQAKHTVWQQGLREMPKAEMHELDFALRKCLKDRNYIQAADSDKSIIAEDCYRWLVHIQWSHVFVPPELLGRLEELNAEWAAAHPELPQLLQPRDRSWEGYPSPDSIRSSGSSSSSSSPEGDSEGPPANSERMSSARALIRDPGLAGRRFVQGLMGQHVTMPAFFGAGTSGGGGRAGRVKVLRLAFPGRRPF